MFAHIRRHQKWLLAVVVGATIISFVAFLDPSTGRRGGGRSIFSHGTGDYGSINGRAISLEEYDEVKREALLAYLLSTGRWPEEDEASQQFFNLDRAVATRLAWLE